MTHSTRCILRGQTFTIGLAATLVLAFLAPEIGATSGLLHPKTTTKLAVALVFLIQGVSIPGKQLLQSLARPKIHVFCLACNFALAPALMQLMLSVSSRWISPELHPSLLYLSLVPTTISSAIVFTASSGGNRATALFSATLSNVLGIVATPLLCLTLIDLGEPNFPPILPLFGKLALLALLPLAAGQTVRRLSSIDFDRKAALLKRAANGLILFIVFVTFCNSMSNESWTRIDAQATILLLAFTLVFLLAQSSLTWLGAGLVTKDPANRTAAFFCGSQKTLAAGAPMAAIIFSEVGPQTTGLLILPLIAYHALQLLLAGIASPALIRRTDRGTSNGPSPANDREEEDENTNALKR